MKRYLIVLLLLISLATFGQPLRDINFEYLYNPNSAVRLELKPVRNGTSYIILYNLEVKDTASLMSDYSLEWEARNMLSDKEGRPISLSDLVVSRHASGLQGRGTLSAAEAPRYLVGKVTKQSSRRAWLFYTALQPNYPVNNYLLKNGFVVTDHYVRTTEPVNLGLDSGQWIVSYYDDNFPAAAPAFSESQARVSRTMKVDSVFTISGSDVLRFPAKGLYLIQRDTTSTEGIAIRAEDDYPQYTKLASLADPFVYITTRQEHDKLLAARDNKKAFDRTILGIAIDTERARTLMRNYFRRVELANRYFTSYKEGWKTDRGMVYTIFGIPDEVFKFESREVWTYKTGRVDATFVFTRSSSLFDPDNYILIREKKYEKTWYDVVDLWRNARY